MLSYPYFFYSAVATPMRISAQPKYMSFLPPNSTKPCENTV